MNNVFKSLNSKSSFNIPIFLLTYALLSLWFYCFIGITSPGGKGYSPFIDHYLNITTWLTWFISKTTLFILKWIGFSAYQRAPNNVTIIGSRGVTILWACLGFGVMSFWTAFITAHRADWKYKLKWIGGGVSSIILLNIIRIALIALANHYHWLAVTSLEPHETFNVVSYIILFMMIGLFVWRYKQYEKQLPAEAKTSTSTAPLPV